MADFFMNERLDDRCFAKLVDLTHDLTGITIAGDRKAMLVSRLRKRLRASGSTDFVSYLDLVRSNREEAEEFVNCVTTNKTYFYRTPLVWQYIEETFLKKRLSGELRRPIRVWSAAASSGEEAYTMGALLEDAKTRSPSLTYEILGTDIAADVVRRAKQGLYPRRAVEGFRESRPDVFDRQMVAREDGQFEVRSGIRSHITFQVHNLFRQLCGNTKFDIVLLRNVLIYFTKADQEHVLAHVASAMADDGVLAIGESESITQLASNFESIGPLLYRKRRAQSAEAA